jgi:hypothetical protein
MSGEPPTPPSPELRGLLRTLGEQPLPPALTAAQPAREARIAERIDAQLTTLVRARRSARRGYVALAAAAMALLAFGAVALRRPAPALVIQREPPPAPSPPVPKLEPPRAAAPVPSDTHLVLPRRRTDAARVEGLAGTASTDSPAEPVSTGGGANSTLARENRLFREAAEAARSGDRERALTLFDQLFRDHPTSPLAQTALVKRFRLLVTSGRMEEARREATRYLEAFPNGFAMGEARALTTGTLDAGRSESEREH